MCASGKDPGVVVMTQCQTGQMLLNSQGWDGGSNLAEADGESCLLP